MSGNASFKMFAVLLLSYSSKTSKYKFPSLLSYVYTLITLTGPCAFSSNSSPELFLQGKLTQTLFSFSLCSQGTFSKGISEMGIPSLLLLNQGTF